MVADEEMKVENLEAPYPDESNCIHMAVLLNHSKMIPYFAEQGIDANHGNVLGQTPFKISLSTENYKCSKSLLLLDGINPQKHYMYYHKPLHMLFRKKEFRIALMMLEKR